MEKTKPKVYYFYTSFYSQKVLMFLNEKEVDFDAQVVNLASREHQSAWYLAINPRGEVPAMTVGEEIINGSDAILDYLEKNNLGKKSIYPSDPDQLSKHNYFIEKFAPLPIDAITYGTAYFPNVRTVKKGPVKWPFTIFMKHVMDQRSSDLRKKAAENAGTPAEAVLLAKADEHDKRHHLFSTETEHRRMLTEMNELLDEVEKELDSHKEMKWLVGDSFTAADCILAIILKRLYWLGHEDYMDAEHRPALAAWWDRAKNRECFIKSTWEPNIFLHMLKTKIGLI